MKVYLGQIPQGEQLHLVGEENAAPLGLEEIGIRPLSPLSYDLYIGISDGGLFAVGQLRITVELRCVATLDLFPHEVEIGDFATQIELHGPECVDLTPVIREDILLSLPTHPRRRESIVDPAYIAHPPETSETKAAAAWSALEGFKPKN